MLDKELVQLVREHLNKQDYHMVLLSKFGSHIFGLDSHNSDTDLFCVFSKNYSDYVGLDIDDNPLKTVELAQDVTVQFMDVRRAYSHARKSNFTLYTALFAPLFQHTNFKVERGNFSQVKLAHHALGLIDNKSQRPYMAAYAHLFVDFLMQNKRLPYSLEYLYLLDNVTNTHSSVTETLEMKKQGIKDNGYKFALPYSHEELNQQLPDNQYNKLNNEWLVFLESLR